MLSTIYITIPVDKFGRSVIEDKSDVTVTFLNNSFVRRDGGNTVTGSINMMETALALWMILIIVKQGCSN